MLVFYFLTIFSLYANEKNLTCFGDDIVVRFMDNEKIHVSGKGHDFEVKQPKIDKSINQTSYSGKASYQKDYGHRNVLIVIKPNGLGELNLQMTNRASIQSKLNCKSDSK